MILTSILLCILWMTVSLCKADTVRAESSTWDLVVDVGYAAYRGYQDVAFDMNVWRGIRYAQAPLGYLRWKLPQPPTAKVDEIINATTNPNICPQSFSAQDTPFQPITEGEGDEDCLFLNVFSPNGKKGLPTLIWIHGGGYGMGSLGLFDFSYMDQMVGNEFVFVSIQYRLGAFGFLSSEDLAQHGTPNVGLHDQRLAFQWVQDHISKFGGDPSRVTIAGESAGAGSVMLAAIMNKGSDGDSLWQRGIATSPYLPAQWDYNDPHPTQMYYRFAEAAGCIPNGHDQRISDIQDSTFRCLQEADTATLKNASAFTSQDTVYGGWAFNPVTDYRLVWERPTTRLLTSGELNGRRLLIGYNANEGTYFTFGPLDYPASVAFLPNHFVPQNITTQGYFIDFLRASHPLLSDHDISALMTSYMLDPNMDAGGPKFDSTGDTPPFATSVSSYARGWQQAANNLYAEANFACPAFWLAEGFSTPATAVPDGNVARMVVFPDTFVLGGEHILPSGSHDIPILAEPRKAWIYQFSPPDALHGIDLEPLLNSPKKTGTKMNANFRSGLQNIWARFIIDGDPTLPSEITRKAPVDRLEAAGQDSWKPWGESGNHSLLILNVTDSTPHLSDWRVVDGNEWEGGRRRRCSIWATLGPLVKR